MFCPRHTMVKEHLMLKRLQINYASTKVNPLEKSSHCHISSYLLTATETIFFLKKCFLMIACDLQRYNNVLPVAKGLF